LLANGHLTGTHRREEIANLDNDQGIHKPRWILLCDGSRPRSPQRQSHWREEMNQYQEHLQDSQPDNSRWDGWDCGDTGFEIDQGSQVIGRMTSGGGYKVEIIEHWSGCDTYLLMEKECIGLMMIALRQLWLPVGG
jgi:hypothetical protein